MDKVTQELVTVTPEIASDWLISRPYNKQRQVRPANVEFLTELMRDNKFKQGTQIAFAGLNGSAEGFVLINGQHTLSAIVKSECPQLLSIVYHRVDTPRDIDWLYTQEDRQRPRNVFDTYKSLDVLERMGLEAKSQLNATGTSVKTIMAGFSRPKHLIRDEIFLSKMLEYKEAAQNFFAAIANAERDVRSGFYRRTTLSVGLVTFRYSAKIMGTTKVTEFWNGAAINDGLRTGDPRKSLLYHLRNDVLGSVMGPGKRRVSERFAIQIVAECWNAWVDDCALPLRPDIPIGDPFHIAGTPFIDPDRI